MAKEKCISPEVVEETSLTQPEKNRLGELEDVVGKAQKAQFQAAEALLEIRDSRLYRESHPTFELYLYEKWGIGRQYAYRLIGSATVMKTLSPIGDKIGRLPENECQTRALSRAKEPEKQLTIWENLVRKAGDEPITAKMIDEEVDRVLKPKKKKKAAPPKKQPPPPPEPEQPPDQEGIFEPDEAQLDIYTPEMHKLFHDLQKAVFEESKDGFRNTSKDWIWIQLKGIYDLCNFQ